MSTSTFWTFITIFVMSSSLLAESPAPAQSIKDVLITVEYKDATLERVFSDIEAKTNFTFFYDKAAVQSSSKRVTIARIQATVARILQKLQTKPV